MSFLRPSRDGSGAPRTSCPGSCRTSRTSRPPRWGSCSWGLAPKRLLGNSPKTAKSAEPRSALGPLPRWRVEHSLTLDRRLTELFRERDRVAGLRFLERRDHARGMRNHPHLRALRRLLDEARKRGQQVGMQAGLGLVEDHERWRPRRE